MLLDKIAFLTSFVAFTRGHVSMSYPTPRGSPGHPETGLPDYNLSSPLKSPLMCNGKPPGQVVASYNAGDTIPVRFSGSARHGGGKCQFALSYDSGTSFITFLDIEGSCPDSSYVWNVRLPSNLPSCEKCIFAWTWINAIGNREYYMNCADIKIIGGPGSKIVGSPLHIANLEGYPVEQPLAAYGTPESSAFNYKSIQAV